MRRLARGGAEEARPMHGASGEGTALHRSEARRRVRGVPVLRTAVFLAAARALRHRRGVAPRNLALSQPDDLAVRHRLSPAYRSVVAFRHLRSRRRSSSDGLVPR